MSGLLTEPPRPPHQHDAPASGVRWMIGVRPLARASCWWDARPQTAELRIEQQAVNLLNVWFAKSLSKAELLERIRSDQTISESVRKQALVLAERSRKS